MNDTHDNGIVRIPSGHGVGETVDRLEEFLKSRGMLVFARIDQREYARGVGLELRPTQLLLFGSPKGGTPLMDAYPTLALDLPMKAVVWEESDGVVWLAYNSPEWLQSRHGTAEPVLPALQEIFRAAAG